MRAAVIAEGRGDLAVIANILNGKLGIDQTELKFLLPEYDYDQTDLAQMPEQEFSNWTLVKNKCENRGDLEIFLDLHENSFLVIQIDTAERIERNYEVLSSLKTELSQDDYCIQLRENIIEKIDEWLDYHFKGKIAYAICIEETESWVAVLYGGTDTSKWNNPKEKLKEIHNRTLPNKKRNILRLKGEEFDKMKYLSSDFSKKKKLAQVVSGNKSLKLFCLSLENWKE